MTAEILDPKPHGMDRRPLVLNLLVMPLFFALFMFLPAGTWAWAKGWLFILVFLVLAGLASLYVRHANPELLSAGINAHRTPRSRTPLSTWPTLARRSWRWLIFDSAMLQN